MPVAPALSSLRRAPQALLIGLVRGYRLFLSPWLGSACRFEPTCSRYAIEALERHGAAAGSYLTLARLGRCHPWCAGGCDPVPAQRPRLFSRLFASATVEKTTAGTDSLSSPRPLP